MKQETEGPPGMSPAIIEEAQGAVSHHYSPPFGTGWCQNRCGCWRRQDAAGGPDGVDPEGACPGRRKELLEWDARNRLTDAAPALLSTLTTTYPIRGRTLSSPELLDVAARMILAGRGFLGMREGVAEALRGKAEREREAIKKAGGGGE